LSRNFLLFNYEHLALRTFSLPFPLLVLHFLHTMAPGIINGSPIVSDLTLPDGVSESYQMPTRETTNKLFSLSGRTIPVTGAGRGLGITLAAAVLEAGGNVACLDILCEPLKSEWSSLQSTAKASALHVSYHKCDITNEGEVQRVLGDVDIVAQRLSAPFYGLIACAGIIAKNASFGICCGRL
jgi:short chain dehydrogenase